jgi:hypothetical protein
LWRVLKTTGLAVMFNVTQRAMMTVKNSIVTLQNTDAVQLSRVAEASGTGATFASLGYNFLHAYVEALDLGVWASQATDQVVDPGFASSACATPVLIPDGSAREVLGRNVALWKASSIAWHPGALEPFNLATLTSVAGAGTSAVWGERKQRVYERPLMSNNTRGLRGRGIRVRVRSLDERSQKMIQGVWVKHLQEGIS